MSEKQRTKPKILVLSLTYLPYLGGAEVAVKEISSRLEGFFAFDILTARLDRKLPKYEQIDGIDVYRIGVGHKTIDKYIFTFFGFFKALRLHLKNRYSIVWSIMAAYSSFSALFRIFTKTKVVLTLQEGDPIEYITGLKRFKIFLPAYKIYFMLVNRVTVISSFLGNWAEYLGVKKEKIVLVPNGVDIQKFSGIDKKKDKENKIIFSDSRLVKKSGLEYLIKAMKVLNYSDAKLVILSAGPLEKDLKNLTKELDIEDKVKFLGRVPYDQIQKYYAQADVFCRPSLSEGFGNVFVQAMAAEIPVIATPVGGILDFVKDKETGWFCEVKNHESIAEKIKYILDDKNTVEVNRVVGNAKKMVKEKYTWDKVSQDMNKVFKELC
jgi:glycosyltransferase involved in cell wall biosynthesis